MRQHVAEVLTMAQAGVVLISAAFGGQVLFGVRLGVKPAISNCHHKAVDPVVLGMTRAKQDVHCSGYIRLAEVLRLLPEATLET